MPALAASAGDRPEGLDGHPLTCTASEVAAAIEGMMRHATAMEAEGNYVDSHGQSEIGLEQLRERAVARTEAAVPAPWTDRLPELAARPLDGDTAGAVIA
ncbi:hypothetical protein CD790_33765 [Streptomyces sp. SAJ15]|nr:Tn3 family transposase [Streptomyces sp. SAJ15]TVL87249.1 hypothetical protein CD790_33765 [Streptomyces sp. SAJ15]